MTQAKCTGKDITQRIHVWCIFLHLVDFDGELVNVGKYAYPLLLGGPPRYNHSRPFLVGLLWFPCGPTVESHIPISDLTQKRPWYPEERSKMIIHQTTH